jgi:NAD-specific glutamate dehydrogenase
MSISKDQRKIWGFKKWARRHDAVFSFLAPALGTREVATIVQALEARGYRFDERGTPMVESEEGCEGLISALREVLEEVIVEKATADLNATLKKFWQKLGVDESLLDELAKAEDKEV